jgi:hypothetical protein
MGDDHLSQTAQQCQDPVHHQTDTHTNPGKQQRYAHPDIPPPAFWDNLSTIPLTKNALRELERRNEQRTGEPDHPTQAHPSCPGGSDCPDYPDPKKVRNPYILISYYLL